MKRNRMKIFSKALLTLMLILLLGAVVTEAKEAEPAANEAVTSNSPRAALKSPSQSGRWVKKEDGWRFRLKDGSYAQSQWLKIKNSIYCFDQEGRRVTGWLTYRKGAYYLHKNGQMASGWTKIGKNKYYFKKTGAMAKGRWLSRGGNTYYLNEDGRMATGWLTLGKKKYYLTKDGTLVTGDYFIKGKGYHFDRSGVYMPKVKVRIDPSKPMVALTFDDGPGIYTERLLDCLEKNHAAATFFLVGRSVSRHSATVKRAFQMGCELGNHSWDHPQLSKLSSAAIQDQLRRTDTAIRQVTGQNPTLMRPPYMAYNGTVTAAANAPVILWDVDTLDWKTRNPPSTISSVLSKAQDGSIILMHDIHLPTVTAVEQLIPMLKQKGYQLVTVSELAKYKGKSLQAGAVYSHLR